jgi:hypothetical protein
MSKQWKDKTKGGDPVENVRPNNDGVWKWVGEIISQDGGRSTVTWTENGHFYVDQRNDEYDLIPIEPEAPSPAKVRVDLALAAYAFRAAVVEFQRYEDQKDNLARVLSDAFAGSRKTEVVMKIEGDHYYFWTENAKVFFRKIEVL